MQTVEDNARCIMGILQGRRNWQASAMLVSYVKLELPHQEQVKHFERHHEDSEQCEMYMPYSRVQYHLRVSEIKPRV